MYLLRLQVRRGRVVAQEGWPVVGEETATSPQGRIWPLVEVRWAPVGTLAVQALRHPWLVKRVQEALAEPRRLRSLGVPRGRRWVEVDLEGDPVGVSAHLGLVFRRLGRCRECGGIFEARPNRRLCDACGRVSLSPGKARVWRRVQDRLRRRPGGLNLVRQARADLVALSWKEWVAKWNRRLKPGRKPKQGVLA